MWHDPLVQVPPRIWLKFTHLVQRHFSLVAGGLIGIGIAVWLLATYGYRPSQSDLASTTPPMVVPTTTPSQPAGVVGSNPDVPSSFDGISTPPPPAPARDSVTTHLVATGETLWQIADQYHLRPETLLWANDIGNADLIIAGSTLVIPPADGVLYSVQDGDHLADISQRYGLSISAILEGNDLSDPDLLVTGQTLFLAGARPVRAAASPATSSAADDGSTPADVTLPSNIDDILASGWLEVADTTDFYKSAGSASSVLDQLPSGAPLERLDGTSGDRIQVRDPGDGQTREAFTGWVSAFSVVPGVAPPSRTLPLAYPADTSMDMPQVFAPYRSQLDGSPYATANCGPTTIGMGLSAFGVDVPPAEVRAEALDAQKMWGNGVGTLITGLAGVVQEHGLTPVGLYDATGALQHWTTDDIAYQVQLGHPVVVQVRYRALPGRESTAFYGDHYLLVTGLVPDGFLYNDPIDHDGIGWDRVMTASQLTTAMNASASQYAYTAFGISA